MLDATFCPQGLSYDVTMTEHIALWAETPTRDPSTVRRQARCTAIRAHAAQEEVAVAR